MTLCADALQAIQIQMNHNWLSFLKPYMTGGGAVMLGKAATSLEPIMQSLAKDLEGLFSPIVYASPNGHHAPVIWSQLQSATQAGLALLLVNALKNVQQSPHGQLSTMMMNVAAANIKTHRSVLQQPTWPQGVNIGFKTLVV